MSDDKPVMEVRPCNVREGDFNLIINGVVVGFVRTKHNTFSVDKYFLKKAGYDLRLSDCEALLQERGPTIQ